MSMVFSSAALSAEITNWGGRLEELAVLTDRSFGYLDRVRRGQVCPSRQTIERLADALGCQPGDLFADDGRPRGQPPPGGKAPPPMRPETREKLRQLLDLRGAGAA